MKKYGVAVLVAIFLVFVCSVFIGCNQNDDNAELKFTVNTNGGTEDGSVAIIRKGQAIALPDTQKEGYELSGWFLDEKLTIPFNSETVSSLDFNGKLGGILFAGWKPVYFNIYYVLNGGVNHANNATSYTVEDEIILLAPQREGYTFAGWYDNNLFFGQPITSIPVGSIGERTFYAKWMPYDITYHLNGGINNIANVPTYDGSADIVLHAPTKEGYTFAGWFDNPAFEGDAITLIPQGSTRNREFYAKWNIKNYTISYDVRGGENGDNPATYTIADTIIFNAATRQGYEFMGWRNQANDEKVDRINPGAVGDLVLYAEWKPVEYNIIYNLDGGVNNPANPDTYTIEDEIIFTEPHKDGYQFSGWFDAYNNRVLGLSQRTGNVVVYAQWQVIIYEVSYNLDGGVNSSYNPNTYDMERYYELRPASKVNYIFKGWYDNAAFEGQMITHLPIEDYYDDITLYAKFLPELDIIYYLDGGQNHSDNQIVFTIEDSVTLYDPQKTGYIFLGWYDNESFEGQPITSIPTGTYQNVFLYAKWQAVEYSITYYLDGGTDNTNPASYTIEDENIVLTAPYKHGYTFEGWYNNINHTGNKITMIPKGSVGDRTLYAAWTPTAYSITYHLDGGNNALNNPQTYTINDTVIFYNPTKAGYEFDGWYTDADFTNPIAEIPQNSTGDVVIYAKFLQLYTISYQTNGGINDAKNPSNYTIKDSFILYPALRTGYRFIGWYDNAGFTGDVVDEIEQGTSGNIVLYAEFLIEYGITYVVYGGENNPLNPSGYVETEEIIFESPAKIGYTFIGWYDSEDFDNEITGISFGSQGNITVYALFEVIVYDINYHLDGGSNHPYNVSSYTVEDDSIILMPASKEGYSFKGWYNNGSFEGNPINSIQHGSVGDINLYAKFLKIYHITYLLDGGQNDSDNASTYTQDQTIILKPAIPRDGYRFLYWQLDGEEIQAISGMSGDLTIEAVYEIIQYDITYHLDGGTTNSPSSYTVADTVVLLDAEKAHFVFLGWYDNPDFEGDAITQIESGSSGAKEFYALYEPRQYTITYHLSGSENNPLNPSQYTIFDSFELKTPTRNGFDFLGWYDNAEYNNAPIAAIEEGSHGDIDLFAKWEIKTYIIEYNLKGGINSPLNPTTYTALDTVIFHDPVREEYTFGGWYDFDPSNLSNEELDEKTPITRFEAGTVGNKALYARWLSEVYTITYVLNGGVNNYNNPETYTRDMRITLYSPTKIDHTFIGWYDNPQFLGEPITVIPSGSEGNKTFYAKFSLTYYITYILNGGSYHNEPSTYTQDDDTIILGQPIKSGFVFMGWYANAQFNGEIITEIPAGSTGDKTFHAKFLQQYAVSYFLDNGVNHPDNPNVYTVEDSFTLKDPVKTGYIFVGWYAEATFDTQVYGVEAGITGELKFFAKFLFINELNYILNGGINSPLNPLSFTVEDNYDLYPATRQGYSFEGWYSNANFLGDPITRVGEGSSGLRNLYAKWEIINYTVDYVLNNGINNINNPTDYNIESPTLQLYEPGRTYYEFLGWYDNADFTGNRIEQIISGSTGNLTFYAKWQPIVYTITYELSGGVNNPSNPLTYTIESETIVFGDAQKAGANFVAWYDNPAYSGSSVLGIAKGSVGNRIFYAKWDLIEYNIIYHIDSGASNSPSNPATYNVDSNITLQGAVKGYYTFIGWYDNPDFEGEKITVITGRTGDLHLYSRFSLTYFINYNLNGGVNNPLNSPSFTELSSDIILQAPQKDYYEFEGWHTSADFSTEPITLIPSGTTDDINLYAKWSPKEFSIIYHLGGDGENPNPATYTVETDNINLQAPVRNGYSFQGWYDNAGYQGVPIEVIPMGSVGNREYYAKWEVITYQITYYLDGGVNSIYNPTSYNIQSSNIILEEPLKSYYIFQGWYDNANFEGEAATGIPSGSWGNKEFYALWTPVIYNINYHLYGGVNAASNPHSYTYEDEYILEEPTREYYIFENWYLNSSFTGNPITKIENRNGELNLYAKWIPISFNIIYSLDGGINHLDNPDKYTIETNIILQKATKANYNFMGWYDNPDFEGQPVIQIANRTGDMILYAKFLLAYRITYYLDDGENNVLNPETYTEEDEIILLAPHKANHIFMGWYDNPDYAGDTVSGIPLGESGDKAFYAKFMIAYRITYHLNGGANDEQNPPYYLEDNDIALKNPSRAGYMFLGWYDNPNFEGEPIYIIHGQDKADVTLYARWEQAGYYLYFGEYPQSLAIDEAVAQMGSQADADGYYTSSYDNMRYALLDGKYYKVEPIRWRVITYAEGKATLLADIILDAGAYNDLYQSITWENSKLRTWLNDAFYSAAFNGSFDNVVNSLTQTSVNPAHNTQSGNAVYDNVRLMSIEEMLNNEYGFNSSYGYADNNRIAKVTDYAKARGAYANESGNGIWWLYSAGSNSKYAAYVGAEGKIYTNGNNITLPYYGIRPSICLQLTAD